VNVGETTLYLRHMCVTDRR